MVVVSGSWVKNVAIYPTPTIINNDMVIPSENHQAMAAKAILICCPNSHHFQDRTLTLDQPVKIGRSVARAKVTPTNAIFDCKVLSRHHALLWYENGKFYLQDTKSSNGTFVNNNRLSAETENLEVSSGDIVQFGVDVVENNRKVTHGCIIATLKLYLPDGKEAKASPSITGGVIPLDELYALNQIIQEANQREQCLETKLTALQHVVEETRKSADESWQAYVGEERLLSRISALENQLQQASKNIGEDRLREEIGALQNHNESYQVAAKEALEKLHAERLEAVAAAAVEERARISAEQEALLVKEQLAQAQLELEAIAHTLTEEQKRASEERSKLEQREQELESQLEAESGRVLDLQIKLRQLNALAITDIAPIELEKRRRSFDTKPYKTKEELIAENELGETDMNKTRNGIEQNHINLTVAPVGDNKDEEKENKFSDDETVDNEEDMTQLNESSLQETVLEANSDGNGKLETKRVTFSLPEEGGDKTDESQNGSEFDKDSQDESEKEDYICEVDSKTLKYQYQSAQNELRKKIELLESVENMNKLKIIELDKCLNEEREISSHRLEESETLKQELGLLQQKLKESANESQRLKDRINVLSTELENAIEKLNEVKKDKKDDTTEKDQSINNSAISSNLITYEQLVNLEGELVVLRDKFSQANEDKVKLQKDILSLTEQYNMLCNQTYNKHFFYFAPLVIMVLYLLVSAMIS